MKVSFFLFLAVATFADQKSMQPSTGKWTPSEEMKFKSSKKTRVQGNILSMEDLKAGEEDALKLTVATPKGKIIVRVGPRWFIPTDAFRLTQGQPITVVGFEFSFEGKKEIVATTLEKENKRLQLREESGKPRWIARQDLDYKALRILMKNCAGCHNQSDHPGAKFLKEADFTETETAKLVRKMISESKMPPEHTNFKNTPDGKFILSWLKRRESDEPKDIQ